MNILCFFSLPVFKKKYSYLFPNCSCIFEICIDILLMSVGEYEIGLRTRGQNLVLFELLVFYPLVERLMYIICFTVDGIVLVSHL